VLDHIGRRTLDCRTIETFVLDECDEMLSMGFLEDIERVVSHLPEKKQTLLFSATMPDEVTRYSRRHMRAPENLSLSRDSISVSEIHHAYYIVSGIARGRDLLKIIFAEEPESAIIFCNMRDETTMVAKYLQKQGLDAEPLSSDLSQADRERVMGRMKAKNLRFLCATDVAARGIDISNLSHVINYSVPESPEVYVHRTGRTGRAGKKGTALSMVGPRELGNFRYVRLQFGIKPEERVLPKDDIFIGKLKHPLPPIGVPQPPDPVQILIRGVTATPSDVERQIFEKLLATANGKRVLAALVAAKLDQLSTKTKPRRERPERTERTERTEGSDEAPRSFDGDRPERGERGERDRGGDRGDRPRFRDRDDRGGGDRGDRPRFRDDRGDRGGDRGDRPRFRDDRGDRGGGDRGDRPRFRDRHEHREGEPTEVIPTAEAGTSAVAEQPPREERHGEHRGEERHGEHRERGERDRDFRGRDRDRGGRDRDRGGRDRDGRDRFRDRDRDRDRGHGAPAQHAEAPVAEGTEAAPQDAAPTEAAPQEARTEEHREHRGDRDRDRPRDRDRGDRHEHRDRDRDRNREARLEAAPVEAVEPPTQVIETAAIAEPHATSVDDVARAALEGRNKKKGKPASGDNKEFWETWAETKSTREPEPAPAPAAAAPDEEPAAEERSERRGRDRKRGRDKRETKIDKPEKADKPDKAEKAEKADKPEKRGKREDAAPAAAATAEGAQARLFVNLGKKHGVSADDLRALLAKPIGGDRARIGSVSLRDSHAHVRVPEELVEDIISGVHGTKHDGTEVTVERARA
jgi:ATP-dependent RNA helicase DeaD